MLLILCRNNGSRRYLISYHQTFSEYKKSGDHERGPRSENELYSFSKTSLPIPHTGHSQLSEQPPRGCRGQCRARDHPRQGHRRNRRGRHTYPWYASPLPWRISRSNRSAGPRKPCRDGPRLESLVSIHNILYLFVFIYTDTLYQLYFSHTFPTTIWRWEKRPSITSRTC